MSRDYDPNRCGCGYHESEATRGMWPKQRPQDWHPRPEGQDHDEDVDKDHEEEEEVI